jgi:hypothetical protein
MKLPLFRNPSYYSLLILLIILSVFRFTHIDTREISWDVFGYYLYLPATFIHHDPFLSSIEWVKQVNEQYNLASTLYMISSNDEGVPMYFFLMGTAILYLPFFLLGHITAWMTGVPMDGFTWPYQYAMVFGGVIYTCIGLIFVRKLFRHFFSDKLSALLMVLMVFGTNYIHHLTIKNLETVNILFMLAAILIWKTIQWHIYFRKRDVYVIGVIIGLIFLIKPTETLIILFPLFYGVYSKETWKNKWQLIISHKRTLIIAGLLTSLILLPQMIYWFKLTGKPIYDSYKNPGVGLDLFEPHIWNVLFSFRKGWFIYTPLMLFIIPGFVLFYKKNRAVFWSFFIYFIAAFYIISSWSEWWYGAGFSIRPIITLYPVLFVAVGYFFQSIFTWKPWKKIGIIIIVSFFVFLNLFKWWQMLEYIWDPYRTTYAYYKAIFLKTERKEADQKLLLVDRDASYSHELNKNEYRLVKTIVTANKTVTLKEGEEFGDVFTLPYELVTSKDHVWVETSFILENNLSADQAPCFVMLMNRKEGAYGYFAPEIKDSIKNQYTYTYLTPEIRSMKDELKCYIWNRAKKPLKIKHLKVKIWERNINF